VQFTKLPPPESSRILSRFVPKVAPPGRAGAYPFKNVVEVLFLSLPRLPAVPARPGRPPLFSHAATLRVWQPIRRRSPASDWLLRFGPGGGAGRSEKLVCWWRLCRAAPGARFGLRRTRRGTRLRWWRRLGPRNSSKRPGGVLTRRGAAPRTVSTGAGLGQAGGAVPWAGLRPRRRGLVTPIPPTPSPDRGPSRVASGGPACAREERGVAGVPAAIPATAGTKGGGTAVSPPPPAPGLGLPRLVGASGLG
jgi:hypothetical protein